jgi:D-alanyl-D-alanine carboxypeptidase
MIAKISTAIVAAVLAAAPAASATPALLFDASSRAVLYAEDVDTQWHPASLTKVMTAYVTFQAIKDGALTLETKISCSAICNGQGPTKLGLSVGATLTVETALEALIMKSANDVAVMLAEAVAGSYVDFVDYMNGTADRLGMTRTKFGNANGLPDPDQVTTVRDMAKLAAAVVRDFPQYAAMWSLLEMRVNKLYVHTHNDLLINFAGADGMKTGFICDSGFNVIASATRQGQKLIAVVFGEATKQERSARAVKLLEHGFRIYPWEPLFTWQTLDNLPIEEDEKRTVTKPAKVISVVCGTGGHAGHAVVRVRKHQVAVDESGTKGHHARLRGHGLRRGRRGKIAHS